MSRLWYISIYLESNTKARGRREEKEGGVKKETPAILKKYQKTT